MYDSKHQFGCYILIFFWKKNQHRIENVSKKIKTSTFGIIQRNPFNLLNQTLLMIKRITLLLLLVACSLYTFAQKAVDPTNSQGPQTIDEQFENVIKSSNSFEDYKVIKKYKINQLKENTNKHIIDLNNQIGTLNEKIEMQSKEISKLKASLSNTEITLEDTNKEKDSMKFFGSQMSKSSYNTMVWSIAGVLLLGLLFFIFRFKNSNILTKQAQKKLNEVEQDFEDYKRKALEKEQKLGRQLQDERNKLAKATKG